MGGFSSGGRTDAGANRSTASKVGVGNINEKGKKTSSRSGFGNGIVNFFKGGGFTGAIIRAAVKVGKAIKKDFKTRKTNESLLGSSDYQGGKTFSSSTANNNNNDGKENKPQGIEFAKASTTSATILGPAEIQKEAANTIKGPTTSEMSATSTALTGDQLSLANKRKGRRSTNITAKKTLANNYTLSKKSLLG